MRTREATRRDPWVDVGVAVGGFLAFVGCAVVASSGTVGAIERSTFEAINGLPSWIEPFASTMQLAGTLAVGPIVAVVAFILGRGRLAFAAALVTAGKLVAERIVWELVVRERPGTTQLQAVVRGDVPTAGPSFVSGHVLLTTALAWVVTPSLPRRWKPIPWIVVALVAFSRIYLGAHNPLDVVGGAGLGLTLGGLVHVLVKPELG